MNRNRCPHCNGFVEEVLYIDQDVTTVEHTCLSCARDMIEPFVCSISMCYTRKTRNKDEIDV